jgi:large conductance mechanosensitive channel
VTGLAVFLFVVKPYESFSARRTVEEEASTKECPECLSEVPIKARRCPACTSQLTVVN